MSEKKTYRLCIDLDGTICTNKTEGQTYKDVVPQPDTVSILKQLKQDGHYIIIYTARNMVTYNNNIGQIIANQAPVVIDWLKQYDIPYDELLFGKPHADFFIDDKGVRFEGWKNIKTTLNI